MQADYSYKQIEPWTTEELMKLYDLRHRQHLRWEEIANQIKTRTWSSLKRKYSRMNWIEFLKNPDGYNGCNGMVDKPNQDDMWSPEDMNKLHDLIKAGGCYDDIAKEFGRTVKSVEIKYENTDWGAWKKAKEAQCIENMSPDRKQFVVDHLVDSLLKMCDKEPNKLDDIVEKHFLSRTNQEKLPISFKNLKIKAREELEILGLGNPETIDLPPGSYVIVGDSHGTHTRKEIFALMDHINAFLKPKNIIHMGHILDDGNEISWDWERYNNLLILAKEEELRIIQGQRNKFRFKYEIVRNSINIGDLVLINQDIITDYVKTPISSLDPQVFPKKGVVNCHRLEFSTRCCNGETSYITSPGSLCEVHTPKTIKQINYEDGGKTVKQTMPDGYIKYRRMKTTNKYWEQGLLIVQMDKQKNVTVVPCFIKRTDKGMAISYFDKIITSKGVFNPEKKIFVNGDLHCDMHDVNVLDIQEQFCKDYRPDIQVNIGDTFNYSSLNHHVMDRGGVILDKKLLDEAASTTFVLKRVSGWAKESHLLCGNHERFARDFVEKYPQFGEYLDFHFMCDLKNMGYILTPLKSVLKIGSAVFVHGEVKMFGQPGSKIEKIARTFSSKNCFIGHIHRPEIRFGTVSIGLSGMLNQGYNEPEMSNWIHGFGTCNQFMGHSFLTTIVIDNYRCIIGNKTYQPGNLDSWKMKSYRARLTYEF